MSMTICRPIHTRHLKTRTNIPEGVGRSSQKTATRDIIQFRLTDVRPYLPPIDGCDALRADCEIVGRRNMSQRQIWSRAQCGLR